MPAVFVNGDHLRRPVCVGGPMHRPRPVFAQLSEFNDYGDRLIQSDTYEVLCFELEPGAADEVRLVDVKRDLAEARSWLLEN